MTMESVIDRGRRVALARFSREGPIAVKSIPPTSSWCNHSLRSEIDALKCIIDAKDREIELLRMQLIESNRVIEKTREVLVQHPPRQEPLEQEPPVIQNQTSENSLLTSFSDASSGTLRRICSAIQDASGSTTVHDLVSRIKDLCDKEKKYDEIYNSACLYMRFRPGDVSHSSIVKLLQNQGRADLVADGEMLKQAVKKNSGISWTFK